MLLHKQISRPNRQLCIARCSSGPHKAVQQQHLSRRQLLGSSAAVLLTFNTRQALADVVEDLERQLPSLSPPEQQQELPKPYQRTMHKLVKALRTSIEAEAEGAKEFEVRRKADGAKDLVREFVRKWQDSDQLRGDTSHEEMKDALSELGRFYQKNGPRSRLDERTKQSVLQHLEAAEAALPPEERSIIGF